MSEINQLLIKRNELITKIRDIEQTCEGIENEDNVKKISELNLRQAKLSAEKISISSKLSDLEYELNKIAEEIRTLSGTGIDRILQAIKKQRWYFFKNKPKVIMDRNTGILWPNFDYFKDYCMENFGEFGGGSQQELISKYNKKCDNGFTKWTIPTKTQFVNMIKDKSFPYQKGQNYHILEHNDWFCIENSNYVIHLDNLNMAQTSAWFLPCNTSLQVDDYENNVATDNKIYTETERLQFTLSIFVNNGLEPIFNDDEITKLYKKVFVEKPALIQKLNELQEQIECLQQEVLLSSTFDYNSLLLKYDIREIDRSIIKYYKAVLAIIDELMRKLQYFEKAKSEIIRDFNVIGLKLSKKYEGSPNLTVDENEMLKSRQTFFKKHFELGMNAVNTKLLTIKKQAEDIEDRLEIINSGGNSIIELALLEKEERASFNFIVENASTIIKSALLKIEFFEANKKFAKNIITLWENWGEDYKVFKTTLKDELKNTCEDDSIESEVYNAWYEEWRKKRLDIEQRFLPLIEYGLKGNLIDIIDEQPTVIEKVLVILQEYKDAVDNFYLEERKNIYQKFAFQVGGDLQEKLEAESELYKLVTKLQKELQIIIFSLRKSEDRIFLLKWADVLLDLQVDEVLDFVKDKELSKISLDVLTEFADLKRKNFEVYISDSTAYSEELQRREKEYNSLIFKMRKDLMKQ